MLAKQERVIELAQTAFHQQMKLSGIDFRRIRLGRLLSLDVSVGMQDLLGAQRRVCEDPVEALLPEQADWGRQSARTKAASAALFLFAPK